ncbi:glycosyltransferase family 61 protein [Oryzobacter sp. R7]|uniref:glycosyltransferase family 61 protein n=1 Tax=Oryzobacter faecalis TaxID=3388656 RepID=UPI00398C9A30
MTSPRSLAARVVSRAVPGVLRARAAARTTPRVVAVVADLDVGPELQDLLDAEDGPVHVIASESRAEWDLPAHDVTFHAASTLDEVNWVLKMVGPVDRLVNVRTRTSAGHQEDWERLFFNLRKGGEYVVPRERITRDDAPGIFQRLAAVLESQSAPQDALGSLAPGVRSFRSAVSGVRIDPRTIVIGKGNQHFVKVRDADGSRMLAVRGRDLTVRDLVTLPGSTFRHRGSVESFESSVPVADLDTTFDVPPLKVRHYTGRIAMVSNALLWSEEVILPDSFRHHRTPGLHNPALTNVNRHFALVPDRLRPRTERPGSFFHLDSENSGHYGHLVTEVMSRLWGWEHARADDPDVQAVFRVRFPNERDPGLERRLFAAYGIPESAVTWISEPTWLESVYAATPMWHNAVPHYVHPDIGETWRRVSDGLVRGVDRSVDASERLFVSRRATTANRSCRNAPVVEELFSRHGFTVVHPEELDLAQQAHLFREARVVAGFGGSGLFNVFNSRNLEHLVVLNHEAYTARNEHLYAAVLGCAEHYFWSTPDIAHPEGGWSEEAYYSGWELDLDRNREALEKLLGDL